MAKARAAESAVDEIEQTLSLARIDQDRSLSRVRTIIAAALVLVGIGVHFTTGGTSPAAFVFLLAYLVLAIAYDLYPHRTFKTPRARRNRSFAWIAQTTDMIAIALFAPLVAFAAPLHVPYEEALKWVLYLVPATM